MASNSFRIDIELPIRRFEEDLTGMENAFMQNLVKHSTDYGMLFEEGSRALAPRDGGDLESSIQFDPLQISGTTVSGSITAYSEYAWRRHEEPYTEGLRDKYDNGVKEEDYYEDGRGRRTRDKTPWRGEEAGRKYMSRVADLTKDDYDKAMDRVVDDTLRRGST